MSSRRYKWLRDGGPLFMGGKYVKPGKWQKRIRGKLVPYLHGYHVCAAEGVAFLRGDALIEVETEGEEKAGDTDLWVCRTWREVRRLRWGPGDMLDCSYADARAARANTPILCHFALGQIIGRASRNNDVSRALEVAGCAHTAALNARGAGDNTPDVIAERARQRAWIEKRIGEKLT